MHVRLLSLALVFALAGCATDPQPTSAAQEPGLLGRMWNSTQKLNPLGPKLKPHEMKAVPPNLKPLTATISVEPPAPKLSEVRQMNVTLRLVNKGKRLVPLEFLTTQRIDVVIKDKTGKVIERWSEDHRFENHVGIVSVNPGERLEYTASVATREMTAGDTFTVEAWMPAFDSIRATASVTPVK